MLLLTTNENFFLSFLHYFGIRRQICRLLLMKCYRRKYGKFLIASYVFPVYFFHGVLNRELSDKYNGSISFPVASSNSLGIMNSFI